MRNRYEGDSILATLKRVLSDNFIERFEYDKAMGDTITQQSFDPFLRSIDRMHSTADILDIKVSKLEDVFSDLQNDVTSLQFEVNRKTNTTDFKVLQEKVKSLPEEQDLRTIRARLSKTATLDDFYDVKSRITVINEKIGSFMTKEYMNKNIYNMKKDLDLMLGQFISKTSAAEMIEKSHSKITK